MAREFSFQRFFHIRNFTKTNWNLTVCYYHVTYEFQSESTLYSLPECQETLLEALNIYETSNNVAKWQQRYSNPQPLSS